MYKQKFKSIDAIKNTTGFGSRTLAFAKINVGEKMNRCFQPRQEEKRYPNIHTSNSKINT